MLQQEVAAFPGSDLDETRSLQLPDHLGPGHLKSLNLPLGFVNVSRAPSNCGAIPVCDVGCDHSQVLDGIGRMKW
jgi:hypothetical protein